jgi:hypothetical protein
MIESTGDGNQCSAVVAFAPLTISGGKISSTSGFRSISVGDSKEGRPVPVVVSGGTVEAKANGGTAIYVGRGTVTVSGGTVEANGDGGRAIYAQHGVTVSGGTVEANGDGGTAIRSASDIEVSDGTVSAANGRAIHGAAAIRIIGGTVSAADGRAIDTGMLSAVSVKGGLVFAYGSKIATTTSEDMDVVIYIQKASDLAHVVFSMPKQATLNKPTGNGVVVAWNKTKGTRTYTAGTTTDLTMEPAGAAVWGIDGHNTGIRYGTNRFFRIPDITVTTP